jgi:hypothetical protein
MIKLTVTGDLCPLVRAEKFISDRNYHLLFNDTLEVIKDSDFAITNLECPLTEFNTPINKSGPNIKCCPESANLLNYANINVAALANNHILDYGSEGLMNTITVCGDKNIKIVGAGKNLAEARKPLTLKVNNKTINLLNFCEKEFSIAGEDKAGANPVNIIDNFLDIKESKETSDYVIVYLHGGNEYYNLPSPQLKKLCRFYVIAGADAVFVSHSHCASGYEIFNKSPIFYGLGNFIFDWYTKKSVEFYEGYFVKLILDTEINYEIYPYNQFKDESGLQLIKDRGKDLFFDKINTLSSIIKDDDYLRNEWTKYYTKNKKSYLKVIFNLSIYDKLMIKLKLKKIETLLDRNKLNVLYNTIRCESHYNVLIENISELINSR